MKRFLLAVAALAAVCLLAHPATAQIRLYRAPWRSQADKWRPRIETVNQFVDFPADTVPVYNDMTFVRGSTYLALTTTYSGNNQILHPDVVYSQERFGGHSYWMVGSPFPSNEASPAQWENPEIFYSDDRVTWTAIPGNPIDTAAWGGRYNSDPSLLLDNGLLWCFWRDCYRQAGGEPDVGMLKYRTSSDGLTWSAEATAISDATTNSLLAPVVRNVRGTYYLWTNDASASPDKLVYRTASSPAGPWSAPGDCTLNGVQGTDVIWHANVHVFGDKFFLIGTFRGTYDMYAGWSYDGVTFDLQRVYVTPDTSIAWDDNYTYQCSAIWHPYDRYFDVFYGGYDGTSFRIGEGKLLLLPNKHYDLSPLGRIVEILGTDAVGFWPIIESNGTTLADRAGYAHATAHDLTASEDIGDFDTVPRFRRGIHSLELNGTDEGASCADHADFSFISGGNDVAFSVAAWIRTTDLAYRGPILAKHNATTGEEWRFEIRTTLGNLDFYCYDDSGGATAYEGRRSTAAVPVDKWVFVCATRDATQGESASDGFTLYILYDGYTGAVPTASTANDGAGTYVDMEDLTTPLTLGCYATIWRTGSLALPLLVKRELTAAEVIGLYEQGKLALGL